MQRTSVLQTGGFVYDLGMVRRIARMITPVLAVALFAALSVVSAQMMAPDRDAMARSHTIAALGARTAEFCGETGASHDHHCPICHKLPEAPRADVPGTEWRLTHIIENRGGHDLVSGCQTYGTDGAARAPPYTV
ncbi:MAG: hypothetical protein RIE24_26760 [Silicimonas sp.]